MRPPSSPFVTPRGTPTGGVGWLLAALAFILLMAVIGVGWVAWQAMTLLGVP